jgi:hypothetical protein
MELGITNEQELETLRTWLENFEASKRYSNDFFKAGEKNYELYKSYIDSAEKSKYKHSIFVPYSFAYVEDFAAYMMLSFLASPTPCSIQPWMNAVSPELCMELEQIIYRFTMAEETEFVLELEDMIKYMSIYNVSYLLNYPILEDKVVISETKEPMYPGVVESDVKKSLSRINLHAPHPHDIFVEPGTKRLSRSSWVIKRAKEKYETLKKWEKRGDYKNVDAAKGTLGETDPAFKMLREIGLDVGQEAYDFKTNKIEILDCFQDGNVITIGGRRAIIRDTTKNKTRAFKFNFPILDCRTTGAPGEFFGVNLIESMKPTQLELNLVRSQLRDNTSLILNKVFMYDILAGEVDPKTLFSAPGNVIMGMNIHEALKELPISDVSMSVFEEIKSMIYDLQNITSMWDYARGGTPRRKETATGIVRLQQAAQARNEWNLRKIDFYILQKFWRRLIYYIHTNLAEEDYVEIIGKPREETKADEFYALDGNKLKDLFQIQPCTESIVSIKELNTNQFLQAFDRIIQLPVINQNPQGLTTLVKQLLIKLGIKDFKQILPQLSPMGAEIIQGAMAGGAGGMGGQAAPPEFSQGG